MAKWKPIFVPIWKTAPFLRLLLPFVAGIIAGWYLQLPLTIIAIAASLGICLLWIAHVRVRNLPAGFGFINIVLILSVGMALQHLQFQGNHRHFIGAKYVDSSLVAATLTTAPVAKPNSYRAEATVQLYNTETDVWEPASGNIILYFAKDSLPFTIEMGQQIAFYKPLQIIANNGNPGGFNYQEFAAFRGLFYQVYLTPKDYVTHQPHPTISWKKRLHLTREWVLTTLRKYIPPGQSLGVAEALLVGYREDLDKNLVEEYAGTGVAHIIAISGLHLGMIYGILLLLFAPLTRVKHGNKFRAIIITCLLWLFALLTGAGASVLRSALMFSMLLLGDIINRKGNSYNTLAASAFLLLLFDPFLLWNVGFQLSYSAVLSIFIFSGPIGRWIQTPWPWLNKTWQLLSVTLAAQILTLPFVVYHFHQFPVYFMLANLVAVPLTALILYGLISLVVISWLPPVATIAGIAVDYIIKGMNQYIGWINRLPMSRIDEIYLTLPQTLALTAIITLAATWMLLKWQKVAIALLACMLVFAILRGFQWQQTRSQQKLIVYHIPKHTAIDIIHGQQYWFWGDTALLQKGFLSNFHLLPSRIKHQVKKAGYFSPSIVEFEQLQFGEKKLLILHEEPDISAIDSLHTDILLLSANLRIKPHQLLQKIKCQMLVADGNMPQYRALQWQNAADSLHLPFHFTAQHGAFTMDY